MKILDLVLMHKWYDMIESGEKPEEYREITPYWINRLTCLEELEIGHYIGMTPIPFKDYDAARFHRGYTKTTMLFDIKDMSVGVGNKAWGAPDFPTFVIRLGERIYEQ